MTCVNGVVTQLALTGMGTAATTVTQASAISTSTSVAFGNWGGAPLPGFESWINGKPYPYRPYTGSTVISKPCLAGCNPDPTLPGYVGNEYINAGCLCFYSIPLNTSGIPGPWYCPSYIYGSSTTAALSAAGVVSQTLVGPGYIWDSVSTLSGIDLTQSCPPKTGCTAISCQVGLASSTVDSLGQETLTSLGAYLYGTIPASLAALTSLTALLLSSNLLYGTIPSSLGSLTNLVDLEAGGNQLTGSLPASLGGLPSLITLILGNNMLSGQIPDVWFTAPLLTLNLKSNIFSGTIPSTLCSSPVLANAAIPGGMLEFGFTTSIDLGNNQLTGTLPACLCNMTGLLSLDLAHNQLSGTIPDAFAGVGGVMPVNIVLPTNFSLDAFFVNFIMNISGFNVAYTTTDFATTSQGGLGFLGLNNNLFTGTIPASIGSLSWLYKLDLSSNELTGSIPDSLEWLVSGGNCQVAPLYEALLDYASGGGKAPSPWCFDSLRLDSNRLTGAIPAWMANFSNYGTALGLSGNLFESISVAGTLSGPAFSGEWVVTSNGSNYFQPPSVIQVPGPLVFGCPPGFWRSGLDTVVTGTEYFPAPVCSPCAPGLVATQVGTDTCTPCAENQFAAGDGISCTSCPQDAASLPGSQGLSNCTCVHGFVPSWSADGSSFTCNLCPAGTRYNYSATGTSTCVRCGPGFFSALGATQCSQCPLGFSSNADNAGCTACPIGTFYDAATNTCPACSIGTYAANAASSLCLLCPDRTAWLNASVPCAPCPDNAVTSAENASTCTCVHGFVPAFSAGSSSSFTCNLCPAGTRYNYSATGTSTCVRCGPGFFSALGATQCSQCPLGFSSNADNAGCTACPIGTFYDAATNTCPACSIGTYAANAASSLCLLCPDRTAWLNASVPCAPCPDNAVTSPGNAAACACASGFHDVLYGASLESPRCMPCPLGGVCDTGLVAASAGWWRENTTSDTFYKCSDATRCLTETVQGPFSLPGNASARRRLQQQQQQQQQQQEPAANGSAPTNCAPSFTGPICSLCVPGTSQQGNECLPCRSSDSFTSWTPGQKAALIVLCILLSACVIALAFFVPLSPRLERFTGTAVVRTRRLSTSLVTLPRRLSTSLVALPRRFLCCLKKQRRLSEAEHPVERAEEAAPAGAGKAAAVGAASRTEPCFVDAAPARPESAVAAAAASPDRAKPAILPAAKPLSFDAAVVASSWHSEFMGRRLLFERRQLSTEAAPAQEEEQRPSRSAAAVAASQVAGAETAAVGLATSAEMEAEMLPDDDGGGSGSGDDDGSGDEEGGDVVTVLYGHVSKLAAKFSSLTRVLVNFYQISSCAQGARRLRCGCPDLAGQNGGLTPPTLPDTALLRTVAVPWPATFVAFMSKISLINLNFLHLPAAACLSPNMRRASHCPPGDSCRHVLTTSRSLLPASMTSFWPTRSAFWPSSCSPPACGLSASTFAPP